MNDFDDELQTALFNLDTVLKKHTNGRLCGFLVTHDAETKIKESKYGFGRGPNLPFQFCGFDVIVDYSYRF